MRGAGRPRLTASITAAALAGLLAAGCAGGPSASVEEGRLETGDGVLSWVKVGEGPAHVVIHGGPGLDHRYLRPGMDALAEGRALVYYDQRGLGTSVPDSGGARPPISFEGAVSDVGAMADRFADEEGQVGLIAHSWGARPALVWAIRNPDRVRSLVLVSPVEPGSRYQEENRRRQRELTDPRMRERLDSIVEAAPAGWRTDPEIRSEIWRTAFKLVEPDDEVVDRLNLELLPTTAQWGDDVARGLAITGSENVVLWDLLPQLYAPTLIVHGERDVGSPEMARELADSLPGGQAVILEGVGHFPYEAAPERFTEAVDTFLTRTEGR